MAEPYAEWSKTYVRTRAEMFATAVLIAAYAVLPLDLTHLPGGFSLSNSNTPKWEILGPLLAFFFYTVASFWVRSRIENNLLVDPVQRINQVLDRLNTFLNEVRQFDLTAKIPEFVKALGNIRTLETLSGSDPKNHFNMTLASMRHDLTQLGAPSPRDQRLIDSLDGALRATTVYGTEPTLKMLIAKIDEYFETRLTEFEDARTELVRQFEAVAQSHQHFDESTAQFEEQLNEQKQGLVALLEGQSLQFTQALSANTEEMKKVRRVLNNFATLENIERNVLSFWLPLLASLGLVAYALYITISLAVNQPPTHAP